MVYHGRLYAFKLLSDRASIDASEKVLMTFAAEDLESFNYWLISFDDCFKYQDELKAKTEQEAKERAEAEAALAELEAKRKAMEEEKLKELQAFEKRRKELEQVEEEMKQHQLKREEDFKQEEFKRRQSFAAIERPSSMVDVNFAPFQHDKRNSVRLDHIGAHLSRDSHEDDVRSVELSVSKAVAHKFHEDPGPIARGPSFVTKESNFAADDMNTVKQLAAKSRSFTNNNTSKFNLLPSAIPEEALKISTKENEGDSYGPIMHLKDNNLDELLSFSTPNTISPLPLTMSGPIAANSKSGVLKRVDSIRTDSEQDTTAIKEMVFTLKRVVYPADRLARRVKIWYCSGGFSLSSVEEIQQFVDALRLTDDTTLKAFAEEKFENIHDWSNLLEVLRKYEQKMLTDTPPPPTDPNAEPSPEAVVTPVSAPEDHANTNLKFVFEVTIPSKEKTLEFEVTDGFDLDAFIKQVRIIASLYSFFSFPFYSNHTIYDILN